MNTVKTEEKREIICSTCHIKFNSVTDYKLHLQTEFHIYNTKRRIAELAPITEEVFEQKRDSMVSANASLVSEVPDAVSFSHSCRIASLERHKIGSTAKIVFIYNSRDWMQFCKLLFIKLIYFVNYFSPITFRKLICCQIE